jgi:hypothetical protein
VRRTDYGQRQFSDGSDDDDDDDDDDDYDDDDRSHDRYKILSLSHGTHSVITLNALFLFTSKPNKSHPVNSQRCDNNAVAPQNQNWRADRAADKLTAVDVYSQTPEPSLVLPTDVIFSSYRTRASLSAVM